MEFALWDALKNVSWVGSCHPQQLDRVVVARWKVFNLKAGFPSPPQLSLFERPGACGT